MTNTLRYVTWILLIATVFGCETHSFRVGQRTSVQFGTVRGVEQVQLQSDAAAGALIGGTIGLMWRPHGYGVHRGDGQWLDRPHHLRSE
jgi:outer membrane lipoprotein SlyB